MSTITDHDGTDVVAQLANEPCSSCGTPTGRHCQTWCELNGTDWDEVE